MGAMTRTAGALALGTVALLVAGCGLPSDGVQTVDDATVPYHLLDDPAASGADDGDGGETPSAAGPLVFWVDERGRLVPRTAPESCPVDLAGLLAELSDGPPQRARGQGLSTALPPESRLRLVSTEGDLVVVDVETDAQVSADRLPVAIGQVVLTVASAPEVARVSLLSNGDPVEVPQADGALTTGPVTPASYASLVPSRYRGSAPFREGRTSEQECRTSR